MGKSVIFKGEVNGVEVNVAEDYYKMIREHIDNGTLTSASSSIKTIDTPEIPEIDTFIGKFPEQFKSFISVIEGVLTTDKYCVGDSISDLFYNRFNTELKKLQEDESNYPWIDKISCILRNETQKLMVHHEHYVGCVYQYKYDLIDQLIKTINTIGDEGVGYDYIKLVKTDMTAARIADKLKGMRRALEDNKRTYDVLNYMIAQISSPQ